MIELKKEINDLCQRRGESARYPLAFEQTDNATTAPAAPSRVDVESKGSDDS